MKQNSHSKTIPLEWLQGQTPEEQDLTKQQWGTNLHILDSLKKLIAKRIDNVVLDYTPDYSNPNWPYRRAHDNGMYVAYKEILNLLP